MATVAASLVATACSLGGGNTPDPTGSGTGPAAAVTNLIIGTPLEPGSLNINRDGDDGNEMVNWSITQPLVDRTAEGLVPVLAAELPTVDDADKTIWHVTLRAGVSFTNGEPFNAAAVKATVDQVLDPEFGASINGIETLKGATVVDDTHVDLITTVPDPWLLYRIVRLHMVPPKAAADADAFSQSPVGTGPYKFIKWEKGKAIYLEKNKEYWGGDDAQLETVEYRFIPDAASRLSALQAGEVDMVTSLTPEDTASVPQVLKSTNDAVGNTLRFNLMTPPYDNVKLRQALIYAIDRESILKNLFAGQGTVQQCQMLPPGEVGFNDTLSAYPYDPEKAKQLLSEIDLPADFKVQAVFTTGTYPKDNEVGQAIAANWEAIGLKTDIEFASTDKWLDDLLAGGEATKNGSPSPMTYNVMDYYGIYASRIANRIYNRTNVVSTLGTAFPEIDQPFKTGETSFDQAEADQAYQDMFKLACDNALNIPLINYPDLWGAQKNVQYQTGPGVIARIHLDEIRVS